MYKVMNLKREFTANKIASDRGIKTDKDSIVLCNGSGELMV